MNGVTVDIRLLLSPRKKHYSYIVILNEIQISIPKKLIHLRELRASDSENYNHLWEIHKEKRSTFYYKVTSEQRDLTIAKILA